MRYLIFIFIIVIFFGAYESAFAQANDPLSTDPVFQIDDYSFEDNYDEDTIASDPIKIESESDNLLVKDTFQERLNFSFELLEEIDGYDDLEVDIDDCNPNKYQDLDRGKLEGCMLFDQLIKYSSKLINNMSTQEDAQHKLRTAKMGDQIDRMKLSREVYRNNHFATSAIFYISHAILIIGFFAALFELWNAQKLRAQAANIREKMDNTEVVASPADIDVTLGFDKLALKSSVNGVALFIITVFFYLIYIKFVYPVV